VLLDPFSLSLELFQVLLEMSDYFLPTVKVPLAGPVATTFVSAVSLTMRMMTTGMMAVVTTSPALLMVTVTASAASVSKLHSETSYISILAITNIIKRRSRFVNTLSGLSMRNF